MKYDREWVERTCAETGMTPFKLAEKIAQEEHGFPYSDHSTSTKLATVLAVDQLNQKRAGVYDPKEDLKREELLSKFLVLPSEAGIVLYNNTKKLQLDDESKS